MKKLEKFLIKKILKKIEAIIPGNATYITNEKMTIRNRKKKVFVKLSKMKGLLELVFYALLSDILKKEGL